MNSKLHMEIQGPVNENGQSDLEKEQSGSTSALHVQTSYRATVINTTSMLVNEQMTRPVEQN